MGNEKEEKIREYREKSREKSRQFGNLGREEKRRAEDRFVRAFPTVKAFFFANFSLRSYFFYFALPLYKTPPSDSLYSTLFYYNIIFSIIFYYIKTPKCQNQFHPFHLPPPPPTLFHHTETTKSNPLSFHRLPPFHLIPNPCSAQAQTTATCLCLETSSFRHRTSLAGRSRSTLCSTTATPLTLR
jgi:hypothetical protein